MKVTIQGLLIDITADDVIKALQEDDNKGLFHLDAALRRLRANEERKCIEEEALLSLENEPVPPKEKKELKFKKKCVDCGKEMYCHPARKRCDSCQDIKEKLKSAMPLPVKSLPTILVKTSSLRDKYKDEEPVIVPAKRRDTYNIDLNI